MKKTLRVISILLITMLLITVSTTCFATEQTNVGGVMINNDGASANINTIAKKAAKIVATLRNVAAIAAVIIIAVLGIKYMLGSVEEKAEYKKSFMPLIVGIVVVVAATQIAALIFSMAS